MEKKPINSDEFLKLFDDQKKIKNQEIVMNRLIDNVKNNIIGSNGIFKTNYC